MPPVYRVNAMTLSDFVSYLRNHGIPCSLDSAKRMIEAGVFDNAAFACTDEVTTTYIIIPKRLNHWFQENADEVREKEDNPNEAVQVQHHRPV